MESKLSEVRKLCSSIQADGAARDKALNDALIVSDKFYDVMTDVTTALRDLKDNVLSQEPPGVDAPTVREQMKELEVSEDVTDILNDICVPILNCM